VVVRIGFLFEGALGVLSGLTLPMLSDLTTFVSLIVAVILPAVRRRGRKLGRLCW